MKTDSRKYPFDIVAGGMQRLPVAGQRFIIAVTSGVVDVSWDGGKLAALDAGEGYVVPTGFHELVLNNNNPTPITGVMLIVDDNYINNRVAGEVSINGGTTFGTTSPAVTTASSTILAANAFRTYALIQNPHAAGNIWLNFSGAAVVGTGLKLPPGGFYETSLVVPLGAINAIGDIASNTLGVLEG